MDFDSKTIFTWLADRILYLVVVLLIFLGSAFASIYSDDKLDLPLTKRIFSTVFSVTIMGLIAGYCIKHYQFDPYLMCFVAAFMGMGAEKISKWMLAIWQKSDGFEDFTRRMVKIIFAVRKAISETEKTDGDSHSTFNEKEHEQSSD